MGFLAILLINALIVVGGGESYDLLRSKINKTNAQLAHITDEVEKKTRINIKVNPVINFNPDINVSPTIKSDNANNNDNINQNQSQIVDGE